MLSDTVEEEEPEILVEIDLPVVIVNTKSLLLALVEHKAVAELLALVVYGNLQAQHTRVVMAANLVLTVVVAAAATMVAAAAVNMAAAAAALHGTIIQNHG
jgi:hypothetical protein